MRRSLWPILVVIAGCEPGKLALDDSASPADTDTDTDTDTDADADADADTDTDTDTDTDPGPVGDCEVDPSLSVLSAGAEEVGVTLARHLSVELSVAAELGVACFGQGDPDEVLYWQLDAATQHEVDLFGLAPSTTYDCRVAPVCPRAEGPASSVTITTAPADSGVPVLIVETPSALTPATPGHFITNSGPCSGSGSDKYAIIWDLDGTLRWYHQLPSDLWNDVVTQYLGNGQVMWGGGYTTSAVPHVITLLGEEVVTADWPEMGSDRYTHEARVLADGRLLAYSWVDNRSGRTNLTGFQIDVTTPDGTALDWTWNSQLALDAGDFPADRDGYHGNWADVVTHTDGSDRVYTSLCYTDWIVAIDPLSGEVIWRLGREGDFEVVDADGAPMGDGGFTDCQHGLEVEGDRVLAYDNGMDDRSYSRAVEYRLDESTMTATLGWQWTEDGWDADWLGDIDWIAGGDRIFLAQGEQDCAWGSGDDVRTRFTEVDKATDEVVWRATYEDDGKMAFRAERIDACREMPNVRWCDGVAAEYHAVSGLFAD